MNVGGLFLIIDKYCMIEATEFAYQAYLDWSVSRRLLSGNKGDGGSGELFVECSGDGYESSASRCCFGKPVAEDSCPRLLKHREFARNIMSINIKLWSSDGVGGKELVVFPLKKRVAAEIRSAFLGKWLLRIEFHPMRLRASTNQASTFLRKQ